MALTRYTSQGRIFHGWYIVAVAIIASAMASFGNYTIGPFVNPMASGLNVSRTAFSWGLTVHSIVSNAVGPILGPIVDRKHGGLLVMSVGGILLGVSLIIISQVTNIWQFNLVFGVLAGVASTAVGTNLITPTIISKWFIRKRGRALAIAAVGNNVGGLILTPLAAFIIVNFGWRDAWVVFGTIALVTIAPLATLFIRRAPEDIGLFPDGEDYVERERSALGGKASLATDYDWSLAQAVRTPSLWLIILSCTLGGFGLGGLPGHVLPALTDKGYSMTFAAGMVTLFSAIVILIKPVWGFLGEKIQVRYLMAASFVVAAFGMLLLIVINEGFIIVLFPVIYALGVSAYMPLTNLIWANYFGRASLGTIRGVLSPIMLVSMSFSPVLTGYVFDSSGTYNMAFIMFAICYILAAVSIFLARRPNLPEEYIGVGIVPR